MVGNRFIDVKNVYEYTKYSVITVQSTGCQSMKYGFLHYESLNDYMRCKLNTRDNYLMHLAPIETLDDTLKFANTIDCRDFTQVDDTMKSFIDERLFNLYREVTHRNIIVRKELADEIVKYINHKLRNLFNIGVYCTTITGRKFNLEKEIGFEKAKFNSRVEYLTGLAKARE